MRRNQAELTDDDLNRLARLGAAVDQIAEAAGIDVEQVRRRLQNTARSSEDSIGPSQAFALISHQLT